MNRVEARRVRFYDTASGRVLADLPGGAISSGERFYNDYVVHDLLAFSPDGTRLVTPATETTAIIWKVPELR